MKEIFEILKNYKFVKKEFFTYIFVWIFVEIVLISIPRLTQELIISIEKGLPKDNLYFWIIMLFWITIFYLLLKFFHRISQWKVRVFMYQEKMIFYREKLLNKNYKNIIDSWTWKLMSIFSRWINAEVNLFSNYLDIIIWWFFKVFIILIIFIFYFPPFISAILFFAIFLHIINFFVRKKINKIAKKESKLYAKDSSLMARIVMDNLIVKISWKQKYELFKSKNILKEISKLSFKIDLLNEYVYIFLEFLLRFLEIWLFLFIWLKILNWWYTVSFLFMLTTYVWILWQPLSTTIFLLWSINRSKEHYKSLQKFINIPNEIENWKEKYIYKKWEIEFKNVDFWYSKNWKQIFKNLNLNFLPWKKNALIWHSWWWKSTITKIILRLFEYQKWEIFIDGQDLKKININTFYKYIWYLPQEPAVFDWTIKENLEYAFDENLEKKDDKILWEALKKAKIDEMIKSLEKWLETEIWEKWIKLSWWEKQRLAIARIFLQNPKIIILDEPTSALDSISEAKITETLNELMKWKTSIIIAHRLQTVINSDNIIIIENWKIENKWKHKDLLEKSDIYKKLVDLQNTEFIK